jgi:hypothetical protein
MIQQDHVRGWRPDPGKGAGIAWQPLLYLFGGKDGIDTRGNSPQPVYRPKRLHQHHGARPPVRAVGPARRDGREVPVARLSADDHQMRKALGGYTGREVGSAGKAHVVPGASQLLRDPLSLGTGTHDDQGPRGERNGLTGGGAEASHRSLDRSREPVHDSRQVPRFGRRWILPQPPLAFPGDGTELGKSIGAAGTGQAMKSGLEGGRGLGTSLVQAGEVRSQLLEPGRKRGQIFSLKRENRRVGRVAHAGPV